MSRLAVAFVVQGEGRGHMTQAMALGRFLRDAGHEVVRVLVGTSPFRSVPAYFAEAMDARVETFDAPTQVPDSAGRGVSVRSTAWDAACRMPRFVAAGFRIHAACRHADVVVNFHDLVGGLSRSILRSRVPAVAVAHNYLFLHPDMAHAPGRPRSRRLVLGYTAGTAGGASWRVALAFAPMPPKPELRLSVAPPLLRPGLDELTPRDEGYLLAYALNAGYGDLLATWQRYHADVTVHCYVDGGPKALAVEPGEGFAAHCLDDRAFLRHLAGCRAYVGSAGFESICEAHYLGKPVLSVPTAGQYEQTLNAWDAQRCGVARTGSYDDLGAFWSAPPAPRADDVRDFRTWVSSAPALIVDLIERAAAGERPTGGPGDRDP